MKILLIAPSLTKPSGRFRVKQFAEPLRAEGHDVTLRSISPDRFWQATGSCLVKRIKSRLATIKRLWSAFINFRDIKNYDVVFMNRDVLPEIRITFIEPFLARLNPNLVFDFDDAIHLGGRGQKLRCIFPSFKSITAGNAGLAEYAATQHENVLIVPTVVDTSLIKPSMHRTPGAIRVGWSGSKDNLKHLDLVRVALIEAAKKVTFEFLVICDEEPDLKLPGVNWKYIKWNEKTECEDLQKIDIGLMPLIDGEFERYKCGAKALLYMGVGAPALVSPVGVNESIVLDGETGFICRDQNDWQKKICTLVEDQDLRNKIGVYARRHVESNYSVSKVLPMLINLFEQIQEPLN